MRAVPEGRTRRCRDAARGAAGTPHRGPTEIVYIWDHPVVAPSSQTPAEEPARDVLAAEAFAMPAADPELRHGPVVLPEDPTGIEEPHDILAAEEFAMPAPQGHPGAGGASRARARRRIAIGGAAATLAGLLTLRRRRR
jgi:hypothetical protein